MVGNNDNHVDDYWTDGDYHVTHIFAISAGEGMQAARAGFGINWGPDDPKNRGGVAVGRKSKLRAELTALRWCVEAAVAYDIKQLIIRHKSSQLSDELENWVKSPTISPNIDLLEEFGALREFVEVWVEQSDEEEIVPFKPARLLARRAVGMHSQAPNPLSNEFWTRGVRIVDLFAAECTGANPVAAYGIYWGPDDPRNLSGLAPGAQNQFRAYLVALYHAMSAAQDSDHDELIIRSRCPALLNFMCTVCLSPGQVSIYGKNMDLMPEILRLVGVFQGLRHLLAPKQIHVTGQTKAEQLARQLIGEVPQRVAIWGKGSMNSRLGEMAKFGVYWGADDARNFAGFMHGPHSDVCAEMRALGTALQQIVAEGSAGVAVCTASEDLRTMLNASRGDWKLNESAECTGVGIRVNDLLVQIPNFQIHVETEGADVAAARRIAELTPPNVVTVGTFGHVIHGNNEPDGFFTVYWGADNSRNQTCRIRGEASLVRTQLIGIRRAIEIAIENRETRLVVVSDYRAENGDDEQLSRDIRTLVGYLEFFKLEKDDNADEFYNQ